MKNVRNTYGCFMYETSKEDKRKIYGIDEKGSVIGVDNIASKMRYPDSFSYKSTENI